MCSLARTFTQDFLAQILNVKRQLKAGFVARRREGLAQPGRQEPGAEPCPVPVPVGRDRRRLAREVPQGPVRVTRGCCIAPEPLRSEMPSICNAQTTQLHPHQSLVAQKQKSGFSVGFLGRNLWAGHAAALWGKSL